MFRILVAILILALVLWPLLATVELYADTRTPMIRIRWAGIASATLCCEDEWELALTVLGFSKRRPLFPMPAGRRRPQTQHRPKRGAGKMPRRLLQRLRRVLKTFTIVELELVIDACDPAHMLLYPLQFCPVLGPYTRFDFTSQGYCRFILRNRPVKALFAWFRA